MTSEVSENRMKALQTILKRSADTYYNGEETISNREYDALYDELVELEAEWGSLPDSITQIAGSQVVDSLPKITHEYPALSLAKTKDVAELIRQMSKGVPESVLMWKLDGGTVIATYENGKLSTLATRGNGAIGSDITHNAAHIQGLPSTIKAKGHIVVRGEAIMTYSEFNRINNALPVGAEQYKNPRNLGNSTISLLDSREMRTRDIEFFAFTYVVRKDPISGKDVRPNTFSGCLAELKDLGFQVVDHQKIRNDEIDSAVEDWSKKVSALDIPVDGLVIANEDIFHAESQPGTGHNPNGLVGFAFKWEDELKKTTLRSIEWSVGRVGAVTPVAIFDPVEICGTTVSRASLHNLSELKRIFAPDPYVGQEISVFKANMIIPQVYSCVPIRELPKEQQIEAFISVINPPTFCPCCKKPLVVSRTKGGSVKNPTVVEVLNCVNSACSKKQVGALAHFGSRDSLNILGLSDEKIAFMLDNGYIASRADLLRKCLSDEPISNGETTLDMEQGWGDQSVSNLKDAVNKAVTTSFVPFLHALGIPNVGEGQAKLLRNYIEANVLELYPTYDPQNPTPIYEILLSMFDADFNFTKIDGIGAVINKSLYEFKVQYVGTRTKEPVSREVEEIYSYLTFTDVLKMGNEPRDGADLSGVVFVVTGDVHMFKNRKELTAKIESLGGKCSGSVSSKTTYLINNDRESTSGKNKKAKELNIPILSEEDFMGLIGE